MAIFLEHAFHYLCSVLQGEWRARPLNIIYSAGFSYITTCNLQTTIERPFVLLSYLTLTKFIHCKNVTLRKGASKILEGGFYSVTWKNIRMEITSCEGYGEERRNDAQHITSVLIQQFITI